MARQYYYAPLEIQTPGGTTAASPKVTTFSIGDWWLHEIQLRIPPGHAGLTGINVSDSGSFILPWTETVDWIIGDNDYVEFSVGDEVTTNLVVTTYNTDFWPHTHYLRFKYTPMVVALGVPPIAMVPVA